MNRMSTEPKEFGNLMKIWEQIWGFNRLGSRRGLKWNSAVVCMVMLKVKLMEAWMMKMRTLVISLAALLVVAGYAGGVWGWPRIRGCSCTRTTSMFTRLHQGFRAVCVHRHQLHWLRLRCAAPAAVSLRPAPVAKTSEKIVAVEKEVRRRSLQVEAVQYGREFRGG